ncbi:chitin deacetylase-like 5 isoform X23 [Musca autumnalis]|uniref:chitin deacetylase-like 5 isoform X23 n=1 Tax=Musca autumnalis TaxID=221902 RepID=UPI003CF6F887
MGLMKHLYCLLWLFGLLSLINNSAAQSQSKRSSRITSSRTSFGTNVKSPSPSSSSSSNSNGVNFDCPEEFGYYPHPTDCTQYYVCVFGGALLESCTGGLMYSHELQTCDWPRNVGCEVVDSGDRDVVISKQQQQQQQPQHVPSRVRFGSSFTSPQAQQQPLQQQQQQQQVLKPTVPPQYHRQPPQVIQAQVQTIPPPPQLKVSPNPVITSRGQPKHLLDAQEEIAKLYADAHDSLPPVEEEESDRQQRVYRGQPSTVSQVQKDRDGILHQASINAIPSNDKYNSYNFGSQYRIESSSPSSSIHSQTATPANIFLQNIRPTPQQHQIQQQQPHEQQQQHHLLQEHQQVIVETIPSTQTQNQNHYRHQQQQQQLPPPLPTLAQPQPFSPNRNYYNITSVSTNYNNNNNHKNNNNNNHNVDVVSYIPQQQQQHQQQQSHQIIPQHSSQQQQQPQLIPQSDIQQSEQSPYDNYYSVYDDDIDLYRDIEYQQQQQHQQQQQQYQQPIRQSTYRPLDVFTTPAPQSAPRETYKPQPQPPRQQERPTYTNQQPLVYNSDYDEDLIAQIEQDNAYDQPTRPPPSRLNSNSNRNRGSSSSSSNSYNQGDIGSAPVTSNRGTHPPRTRPTLKPSGTIVSKAQEFIDIYKNPPSRPEPLYPQPTPDKTAAKCRKDVCLLPDCYCGGKDIPGDLNVEETPQIVLITFDDAVSMLNIELYEELFNNETRKNPNGCPIRGTFYVSHEWTDYGMVQDLYADGHELASHTVSHSFGEQFSQKKWTREVAGQREILAAYGGVKLSDVRGMRAPFLSVGGNKMFKMLYDSNFTYDSSMPVYENRPPSWPYTLDYKIFHDCMIPPCPTKSYPGVWQVPMVMWQDLNGGRCSMGDACSNPSEAEGVTKMIMKNFERHYTTNRAPFGLFYHAAWFTQPHHKEGFIKFLDTINAMPDVWIVTNWQALQWVRDPTPLSRINSFQPFQCDYSDRPKRCNNPKVCNLWHKSGVRYMKTCQPCPDIYPWTGKTGIRSSRIDNDIEDSTA